MKKNNPCIILISIMLSLILVLSGCSSSNYLSGETSFNDTLENGRCLWFDVLSNDNSIDKQDTVIAVRVFDNGAVETYYTNFDYRYYYSSGEITLGDISKLSDDEIIELAKNTEASICEKQCEDLKEALNIIDRYYSGDEIHYDVDLDNVYFYNAFDIETETLVSDDFAELYNHLYEYYSDGIQRKGIWDDFNSHVYALSITTDGSGNNTDTEGIIQYASDCFNLTRSFHEPVITSDIYECYYGGYKSVDTAFVYDMERNLNNYGRGNSIYGQNIYLLTKCSEDTEFVLDEPDNSKFVIDGELFDGAPQWLVDLFEENDE